MRKEEKRETPPGEPGSGPEETALGPAFLAEIPHLPGVYLMKDRTGEVLYVGKARDLRKRLASYARHEPGPPTKTSALLDRVGTVETIITRTEKEALILEASLIKKHRPRYNVILRDDKNYPYIKVTVGEEWPRLIMTRRRVRDGSRYFGPFSSSAAMWKTINYLSSLFPLRRCKGRVLRKKTRSCLNFQLGRCPAPCVGRVARQAYEENVRHVLLALEGRNRQLLRQLETEMRAAAAGLDFEAAAGYRDRIVAIKKTLEKQVVAAKHFFDQDIFGFARQGAAAVIVVLFVRHGLVTGSQSFYLPDPVGDDRGILAEAVSRYYADGRPAPHEVILPFHPDDEGALAEWLADLRGTRVRLVVPKRGGKLQLVAMAAANAEQVFAEQEKKARSWTELAAALEKSLRLSRRPERIECLDISNISGEQAVGSLVCFVRGEKSTDCYRHYRIRSVSGPDDYAMMDEVLRRRLARGAEEGGLPDLLLLDGGKGQLNVARRVIEDLRLGNQVDLVAIAKEREGEGEKLFRPGRKNPLLLSRHSPVLLLLMRIRDEAHRYGITMHRKRRRKETLASELDRLPGVGPARKKALLATLGSLKQVKAATVEELAMVPGLGPELAARIWKMLRPGGNS